MMNIQHSDTFLNLAPTEGISRKSWITHFCLWMQYAIISALLLMLVSPTVALAQSTSGPPTANPFGTTVLENSVANVIPSQTVGTVDTIQITTPPTHGSLIVAGLNFVYTPASNYSGADSFFYTATNIAGISAPARVSITVSQVVPITYPVNATLTVNSINYLINPSITGNPSSIAISSPPSHGTASVSGLKILYTPSAGYIGADSLSYTATNTAGTSSASSVNITVNGLPPTANAVTASVFVNSSANSIPANLSGIASSIALIGSPGHGTASVSGLNIIYTPTPGYIGSDNFYYVASNFYGTSSIAVVNISVNGIPPIANTVNTTVLQNSSANLITSNITGTANSVAVASMPAHGSVSVNGLNFVYTPSATYVGTDVFTYSATNSYGTSATASVNIIVNGVPPSANSVSASVLQDSSSNTIASNVTGGATSLNLFSAPIHGTATVSGMNILYTPSPGFVGSDSFKYTASNAYGTSNIASISIDVNGIPAVANPISASVLQNSSGNTIISNITGNASSIALFSSPSNGTASVSGLSIIYTPTPGFVGVDNFKYTAINAYGVSSAASVSVTVNGIPPGVATVIASVLQNSGANSISTSITGSAASITLVSAPAHGTASVSGLNVIYTPAPDYVGSDTLQYSASNAYGVSNVGAINITVNGVAPVANALRASVLQNSSNNAIPASVSGSVTSLTLAGAPSHGTATISGLNIIYTPTSGYVGTDSLRYTATNAYGTSVAADLIITVNGIPPIANPISASVLQNSSGNSIISNITGSASSIALFSTPSNGTASVSGMSIIYTPTPGFVGVDNFKYTAMNAYGVSSAATVSVTVNGIPPTVATVNASVLQNSSNNAIAASVSGSVTNLNLISAPSHGTATISGLNIIYTPTSGYVGTDSLKYTATNAYGTSAAADLIITVNGIAPIANAVTSTVAANSSNNPVNSNITGNASSIAIASSPLHGTASINGLNIVYTPTAGYAGPDSFSYTASNTYGTSAPAKITMTVNGIVPVASPITASVFANSSNNTIDSITSGGTTSLTIQNTPSSGTVNVKGMTFTYTPNAGFIGNDSFTYTAVNAFGSSAPATVSVQVKDTVPVANSVSVDVFLNSSANAINPNISGNASSLLIATSPAHGVATNRGLQIIYTPTAGFLGDDSFTYQAVNASGTSTAATVTVRVLATTPKANSVNANVLANSTNNVIPANTSGTVDSISLVSQPQHGSAQIVGSSISYTPAHDYVGNDSFNYTATNTFGSSVPATVTITVNPMNPIANAISANVNSNSVNNLISTSTGGSVNSVRIETTPANGTVSVNGLNLIYTPRTGFAGVDTFSYSAAFDNTRSTTASVTVTVINSTIPVANAIDTTVDANSSNNQIAASITGTATSISLKSSASHGTASVEGLKIIYTPTSNFAGLDTFSYAATNAAGTSEVALITINVKGVIPTARPVSATVLSNSSNNAITSSILGDASSIVLGSAPAHGTVSISGLVMSYTPQTDFIGSDSFTYLAKNAFGSSSPALVSIQVNIDPALAVPVTNPVNAEVLTNSSANTVAANITGTYKQINITKAATHGTVSINGNNFSYTPAKDYTGGDSFSYVALNISGSSNEALVSITVKPVAPVAKPVSAIVESNQANAQIRPDISNNTDRIALDTPASHGTVTISGLEFRYTPALNFVGADSFTYVAVNAAGNSSPATVSITVKAKAPVVSNASIQVLAGSSASLELANLVSQTGGAPVSFSILTQPTHGSATLVGTRLTVNAHLNYAGTDQLSIVANANGQASNTAVIAITVTARPDPSKNPAVQALQTSKAAVITQFERLQLENFNARLTEIATQNSGLRSKEDRKKNEDACNKVSLWAGGLNSFSTIAADYEIKQQNGGASFGGDRCLGSPDSVLGFGVGYANSRGELRGLNTNINANARNVANYGQIKPLPFFNFSWVLGINDINSDYTRTTEQINDTMAWAAPPAFGIMTGAPANTTQHSGKWSGKQKLGSSSIGFDITFTDFKMSPYLRLDRSAVTIGAYTESGDPRSALHYQEQSFNSQRTTLGMNTETSVKTSVGELTPRLRFEYQKDVSKRDDVKINYVDNPDSTPYIINGSKQNRNLIHMGIGGDLLLDSGWVIIFNYGYYRASEGNHSNAIRLRLSYRL
ncbi:Ig-like domain-containing protein [Undibacterium flavidum]|uniref:Tandem-95 repeat protein n=1 Tax=Undibacterium flavidum TaxID=2762297 RepID=A0ABR6Y8Y6_9BURK|nr:Ig-like domain-containing protein [Undibacterium flavidum]MBC3873086.1 tandem-95 repeat protein [Undibacterium flavidum]